MPYCRICIYIYISHSKILRELYNKSRLRQEGATEGPTSDLHRRPSIAPLVWAGASRAGLAAAAGAEHAGRHAAAAPRPAPHRGARSQRLRLQGGWGAPPSSADWLAPGFSAVAEVDPANLGLSEKSVGGSL